MYTHTRIYVQYNLCVVCISRVLCVHMFSVFCPGDPEHLREQLCFRVCSCVFVECMFLFQNIFLCICVCISFKVCYCLYVLLNSCLSYVWPNAFVNSTVVAMSRGKVGSISTHLAYMCVYACMCVYVYVYIYIYICIYREGERYIYIYM